MRGVELRQSVSRPEPSSRVHEEAAAWALRMAQGDADPETRAALDAWRGESPEHDRAFADAAEAWDLLGQHATSPELLALRRDALHRARAQGRRRWLGAGLDRRAVAAGIAAAIAIPLAAVGWQRLQAPDERTYATAHGEQRTIVLADGSRLSMDALTQVTVALSRDLRVIELEGGRMNVEVAKDPERPLRVKAAESTVTALGTVFSVERAPQSLVVTLVEGKVAVRSGQGRALTMAAGQELTLGPGAAVALREDVDAEQALAWREGKLIFDDEPLAAAAARMNNYGARRIVVHGAAQGLRISGVFRAGDVEAFVGAVESYFPIDASWDATSVVLRPKTADGVRAPV
jgi:transmembrane sensor